MSPLGAALTAAELDDDGRALVEALVERAGRDPHELIRALGAHRVPPVAVSEIAERLRPELADAPAWATALVEGHAHADRLGRAQALTETALGQLAGELVLVPSPLGPAWARDVDVLVTSRALDEAARALEARGFVDLSRLMYRGRDGVRGSFGAIDGSQILAPVDLASRLYPNGPSTEELLRGGLERPGGGLARVSLAGQLRRQAVKISSARRVTIRDAIVLGVLLEASGPGAASRALTIARHRCGELARATGAPDRSAGGRPTARYPLNPFRARTLAQGAARRLRAPRRSVVVAFSGIDGSGKSTQAGLLVEHLNRVGVPAGQVWARLGYSGSRPLTGAARLGQRLLPKGSHSAQRQRSGGTAVASAPPLTRRGVVGWAWTLAVTLDYLRILRREVRRVSAHVIVLDRGLPDALVALEEEFGGAIDLSLQRRLIVRLLPKPDQSFYMRLPGAVAHVRKEDSFTAGVLDAHVRRYEALLPRLAGRIDALDAQRPVDELAAEVLRRVASVG